MTNCANHDVLRILMLLSHGDWLSFTELQNKTNIDQDRLATILILGTKIYHVFAPSLYNYNHEWSVSKQRRPKDVQDLIYASLNSEDCSIEDVEYYNLAGCVSTDFISDAIYRKLNAQRCKKKTRKKQKSQQKKSIFEQQFYERERKRRAQQIADLHRILASDSASESEAKTTGEGNVRKNKRGKRSTKSQRKAKRIRLKKKGLVHSAGLQFQKELRADLRRLRKMQKEDPNTFDHGAMK